VNPRLAADLQRSAGAGGSTPTVAASGAASGAAGGAAGGTAGGTVWRAAQNLV